MTKERDLAIHRQEEQTQVALSFRDELAAMTKRAEEAEGRVRELIACPSAWEDKCPKCGKPPLFWGAMDNKAVCFCDNERVTQLEADLARCQKEKEETKAKLAAVEAKLKEANDYIDDALCNRNGQTRYEQMLKRAEAAEAREREAYERAADYLQSVGVFPGVVRAVRALATPAKPGGEG